MSYAVERPSASRPVVVGTYHATEDGKLRAGIPMACPHHGVDDQVCRVVVNHYRQRKTGPRYPLVVAECRTHRMAFTIYPPGHVPYGRVPISRLSPDGQVIQREHDEPARAALSGTLFEAAQAAAAGKQWARAEFADSGPWWNTQVRHLAMAERLLGLSPEQSDAERERIASALEIALLDLRCASKSIADVPGYRSRGREVLKVLEVMSRGACVLDRLMASGYRAGLWGVPYVWDQATACLRPPALIARTLRSPPPLR